MNAISNTSLWMRRWKLSVGGGVGDTPSIAGGSGVDVTALDLSQFAFQFSVEQAHNQTNWKGFITVYNLPKDTVAKFEKELTFVSLEAGYQAPSTQYGSIFQGQITYYKYGRRDATDTFVEITAVMQDQSVNDAVINTYLPKGYTKKDVVNACIPALNNVMMGQITDLGSEQSPRGRLVFGMVRDVLRDTAQSAGALWFIDHENHLHMLKPQDVISDVTIPVLNSRSGLLDVPTMTMGGGIEAKCLLNPTIRPGRYIQINEKDVITTITASSGIGLLPDAAKALGLPGQPDLGTSITVAADGFYKVGTVRHRGENRGNAWFSEIMTEPKDPDKKGLAPGGVGV